MSHPVIALDATLEKQARRRASAKMGWIVHAAVFVTINLLLATLAAVSGRNWVMFPAMGWMMGLAIHGIVVFFLTGGAGLHDKLVQRERQRLARDPW